MLRRLRIPMLTALLALGAFAIACSSGSSSSSPAASTAAGGGAASGSASSSLNVTMAEFSVKVDKSEVPAGQVVFKTKNSGATDHELRVIKTDLAADKLPIAGAIVDETKVQVAGTVEQLKALASKDLTVALQPGHYVLICNVAGHYQLGMHADLTVK